MSRSLVVCVRWSVQPTSHAVLPCRVGRGGTVVHRVGMNVPLSRNATVVPMGCRTHLCCARLSKGQERLGGRQPEDGHPSSAQGQQSRLNLAVTHGSWVRAATARPGVGDDEPGPNSGTARWSTYGVRSVAR